MSQFAWLIEEESEGEALDRPPTLLVAWRLIRSALRRRWRIWVGAALVGGLLGLGALLAFPRPSSASATLLLVHPDAGDTTAMSTDVSLLTTRKVAGDVIDELGLSTSPDALLGTITAVPVTNQILKITVAAPDDAEALRRATSTLEKFLEFRAGQLRSVSSGLVNGYQAQVTNLQGQVSSLTKQYADIQASGAQAEERAGDLLAARSLTASQISSLQRSIEDVTLRTESAIGSSHIIDAPAVDPTGSRKAAVLFFVSGAVVLGALAVGIIVVGVVTSERPRRRRDVATALGVPVRVSVGSLRSHGPLSRLRWRMSPTSALGSRRGLRTLAAAFVSAIPWEKAQSGGGRELRLTRGAGSERLPLTLGLAPLGDARAGATVLLVAAAQLAAHGVRVCVVDLSRDAYVQAVARLMPDVYRAAGIEGDSAQFTTVRPEVGAELAVGPLPVATRPSLALTSEPGEVVTEWQAADVVLALVELDPSLDIDNVGTWVTRVVPLVNAGRVSRELLEAVSALVTAAPRLDMPFAMLEGCDADDGSVGLPDSQAQADARPLVAHL